MSQAPNGRPTTILKHNKWKPTASPLPDAKKSQYGNNAPQSPQLEIIPVYNEWHFKVYTNSQSDTKNNGVIEAALDGPTMHSVMVTIAMVADSVLMKAMDPSKPQEYGIQGAVFENKGWYWQGGKRSDQPGVKSMVHIGCDDQGIYLSVRSKGRPEINFYLEPTEFHNLKLKIGGQVADQNVVTKAIHAKAFANAVIKSMVSIDSKHYLTGPEIKAAKEAAKSRAMGGGNNRGGYSQQQPQQQSQPQFQQQPNNLNFDDDLPM